MKRVWALDVLECPRCQGRMRILAAIHSPDAIGKILECLSLPSRAPPVSPAMREFSLPIQPFSEQRRENGRGNLCSHGVGIV